MSAPSPETVSIREFARRDRCDESRVRRAIRSGHLKRSPDGKLDDALVGTGWRETNRRGAETADKTPRTLRTKLRTPHPVSAPVAEAVQDTIMLVPMAVGPSGMHPLAVNLSAMIGGGAMDAAPILLRHLPLDTVRQIVDEMAAYAARGAVELLEDDGIPPPFGMASWTEHPSFARPPMSELDWAQAAADLVAAGVQAVGTAPDA